MDLNQTGCKPRSCIWKWSLAHIPNEKHKALEPKSEKCISVGYSEDIKGYRVLQPNSIEISIRRDVKLDENISSCESNSTFVLSSACNPESMYVPFCSSSLDNTPSDANNNDENPPLPTLVPLLAP